MAMRRDFFTVMSVAPQKTTYFIWIYNLQHLQRSLSFTHSKVLANFNEIMWLKILKPQSGVAVQFIFDRLLL